MGGFRLKFEYRFPSYALNVPGLLFWYSLCILWVFLQSGETMLSKLSFLTRASRSLAKTGFFSSFFGVFFEVPFLRGVRTSFLRFPSRFWGPRGTLFRCLFEKATPFSSKVGNAILDDSTAFLLYFHPPGRPRRASKTRKGTSGKSCFFQC